VADLWVEYDPANALMMPGAFGVPNVMAPQPFSPERGRFGRGRGGQKRRPRAPFSADGPVHDKTRSTIVIESIPEENFTEEQVRGFFSQFGNIVEVSMQPYKRLAVVKYDNWASANAAYKSPKVIFENRFVKVFWFKDEESLLPPSAPANGKAESVAGSGDTETPATLTPAEMEEFLRKQEEAQKAHEEKMKKLQDVERQQQEIETRQQKLLAEQREARVALQAKLAKKTGGTQIGDNGETALKPTTQSEALRAKLAELEAEAKQLGLNPDEAEESSGWDPTGGFGRGRGRGGYYRARGYSPRGAFRGGFRGRGGQHAAYAAYSLDNRPKKVKLVGVDFTVPETDESLRQYLFASPLPPLNSSAAGG
jgi:RNA-binding protein 26